MANLKLTVVGDGAIGKTCLLIGYTKKKFEEKYVPTVFDNYAAVYKLGEESYNLALWDTAGQEDYERLRPLSYPHTTCFLICFSVAHDASFQNVKTKWAPEVNHYCPNTPVILVGLKADLREADNPNLILISEKDARKMKKTVRAHEYLECSAKQLTGLDEVIEAAVRVSLKKKKVVKRECTLL